ncbi:MAG: hypothetical protein LBS30_00665, partial [Planctomycetota bacterium]|nr:hypothetical protein [Planctomycetota bacterium]
RQGNAGHWCGAATKQHGRQRQKTLAFDSGIGSQAPHSFFPAAIPFQYANSIRQVKRENSSIFSLTLSIVYFTMNVFNSEKSPHFSMINQHDRMGSLFPHSPPWH